MVEIRHDADTHRTNGDIFVIDRLKISLFSAHISTQTVRGQMCIRDRDKATVAHLVAGGKDRLNAMYMVEGYGEQNPIVEKSQFVMSLICLLYTSSPTTLSGTRRPQCS